MAPGCWRSVAAASIAVVVEPLRPLPASSTTNTRSASPSKARPEVEPAGDHPGPQVALVGGLQRIGRVVRERAVEFGVHHLELDAGQSLEHRGHDEATHAVGGVGDDPHRADVGRIDEAHDVIGEGVEQVALGASPRQVRLERGRSPSSTRSATACTSARPVSTPIGRAPARHSLMPL